MTNENEKCSKIVSFYPTILEHFTTYIVEFRAIKTWDFPTR